ncbi:MAG: DUF2064 domain-containing protein [Planctomycetes bacterium]|nr:DUF2064 domain-containing protein [Planctomycetota bacterium]
MIGTDSPDLPLFFLQQGLDALLTRDVTLGPSQDSGYYLIGFSRSGFVSTAFEDIAWSTSHVYQQTCGRISRAHCYVHTLPPWHDVDTQEYLAHLIETHRQGPSSIPRTVTWLKEHGWLT